MESMKAETDSTIEMYEEAMWVILSVCAFNIDMTALNELTQQELLDKDFEK